MLRKHAFAAPNDYSGASEYMLPILKRYPLGPEDADERGFARMFSCQDLLLQLILERSAALKRAGRRFLRLALFRALKEWNNYSIILRRFVRKVLIRSPLRLLRIDFLQQSVGVSPLVHHVEHVTDVDADAACQLRIKEDVAREAVPVAVESQSDEASLSVEHG